MADRPNFTDQLQSVGDLKVEDNFGTGTYPISLALSSGLDTIGLHTVAKPRQL